MRDDLVKNSKGKIVSRRKSKQAGEQNNLGVWLRTKGDKFGDKPGKQAVLKDKPVAPKPKPIVKPKPKPIVKPKILKDKVRREEGQVQCDGSEHPGEPAAGKPQPKEQARGEGDR